MRKGCASRGTYFPSARPGDLACAVEEELRHRIQRPIPQGDDPDRLWSDRQFDRQHLERQIVGAETKHIAREKCEVAPLASKLLRMGSENVSMVARGTSNPLAWNASAVSKPRITEVSGRRIQGSLTSSANRTRRRRAQGSLCRQPHKAAR